MSENVIRTVVKQTMCEVIRDNLLSDAGYALASSDGYDRWIESVCAHAAAAVERCCPVSAAAPEISEAMLPENGIDIYVNRIGGKLPIHVSRSSLLAALRAAQGGD